MANLFIVLALLFGVLLVLVKVLEGRAQPLSGEQQQRLSKWIMVLVLVSIVLGLLRHYLG